MNITLLCLFFLWNSCSVAGQGLTNWSFTPSIHVGKILKHTPKITYDPPPLTWGMELEAAFQTYGKKDWHELHHYPRLGVALHFFDLGTPALGTTYGLMPFVTIPLIKGRRLEWNFRFGTGIGYVVKPYDPIEYPNNNAVSTHLNNIVGFQWALEYNLSDNWTLQGGFSFTHYSNGATRLPNFGINIPTGTVGIRYAPKPVAQKNFITQNTSPKPSKRFGLSTYFAIAFKEFLTYRGPRYPVYIGSIAGNYYLSKTNRLMLGIEYEYNSTIFHFGLASLNFQTEQEARQASSRWLIFIGDEFLFGSWGIVLQAGTYLKTSDFLKPAWLYNRLMVRYYLPPMGKPEARIHVGIYLKSHRIVAEYLGFGTGVSF